MIPAGLLLFLTGAALQWIAYTDRNLAATIFGILCMLAGADLLGFCWSLWRLRRVAATPRADNQTQTKD